MQHDAIPGMSPGIELVAELAPYIRHCGDQRRPAWRIEARCLLDYLLVYIADGTGTFTIDGVTYDAEAGDLFWIPPDTEHAMEGAPPSMVCPYVHFDLLYRPGVSHWDFSIPGGMVDLGELRPLMHPPIMHPEIAALPGRIRAYNNQRVGALLQDLCAEAARAQPYTCLSLSGKLLEILGEILRGQADAALVESEHIPLLEEAAGYMIRHAHEDVTVAAMAAFCHVSASHFRRIFKQHFGCSPREHLVRARIRRAKDLMAGTDMNLTEIARRCGFATVHSLSRAFRKVEGIAPSQYRTYGAVATRVEGRATPYAGGGTR